MEGGRERAKKGKWCVRIKERQKESVRERGERESDSPVRVPA